MIAIFKKNDSYQWKAVLCSYWYDYKNHLKTTAEITKSLYLWYEQARELKTFESIIKMIRKHEDEIINFFIFFAIFAKCFTDEKSY